MRGLLLLLAAVLVLVLIGVLVAVLILVGVLVLGTVLVAVLILVLVIHDRSSVYFFLRCSAVPVCPIFQDLSFGLKIRLAISPEMTATVIPPAVAFRPPVKIPRNPSSCTASFTPLARE